MGSRVSIQSTRTISDRPLLIGEILRRNELRTSSQGKMAGIPEENDNVDGSSVNAPIRDPLLNVMGRLKAIIDRPNLE